jgi:hypothetical protein
MNFKSIGLNVAAATVTMAGAALVSSPAQALSFNRGTFDLGGTTSISDISSQAGQVSSFTLASKISSLEIQLKAWRVVL